MNSYLPIYDQKYRPHMAQRADTFSKIFELLEELPHRDYRIVETGCVRGINDWSCGMSTVLWDEFVNLHGGTVRSVDITPRNCQLARTLVSEKTTVTTMDSVEYLWGLELDKPIDLLYLDSFDLDTNNVHPSAMHHIKELLAIISKLEDGCLIVVDDNWDDIHAKGAYLHEFFNNIGIRRVFDGYQVGWRFRR